MIAYLDTNVFDHLYKKIGCTSADIGELRKAVYSRGLSMPIGLHVLEEILLNRRTSPQELVARVKLTSSLASIRRMVKPCDQLIADDIRSYAATGQPDRPLVSAEIQNTFTQGIAELIESDGEEFSDEIAEALEKTRQRKERFVQAVRVSRQQIAPLARAQSTRLDFPDFIELAAPQVAERFAQGAGVLQACRERGGAGLLEIKTVRAAVGMTLSFIYGEVFEGRTSAPCDSVDFLHVPCAAATADIFVTNDLHLRRAVERATLDGLRVMNLAEFIKAARSEDPAL